MESHAVVTSAIDGRIAVITIDSPPVNALGHAVRAGSVEALDRARDDAQVDAVVLASTGRIFCAGADITEFGRRRDHRRSGT